MKKYITVDNSVNFRAMAKDITKHGFKMNHATARNNTIKAIQSFLKHFSRNIGVSLSEEQILKLSKEMNVHRAIGELLQNVYNNDGTKKIT